MIERGTQSATNESFDVIVVGGGILGSCALLEAARRGLRCLLLEREDFGGATSWNSLRILHGGLRYLQTLDRRRFFESVNERKWFCQNFPDLVKPLPCLFPLHGKGLKRASTFRIALAMNDWLSRGRNRGVRCDAKLPNGRVLTAEETVRIFPLVQQQGLQGGGLWYDAVMLNSQRVLVEILHRACQFGAKTANYVEVTELLTHGNKVAGCRARDRVSRRELEFRTGAIINCAGPWVRRLSTVLDRDVPALFRPSLAFNVLLDRAPFSDAAIALQPTTPGAQVYFVVPWQGKMLAGTAHEPLQSPEGQPSPSETQLNRFITGLNAAVRGFDIRDHDIQRVYAGVLPVGHRGSTQLTKRPVIHDHGRCGGPRGLVSVCGIKFTTARQVAEQALRRIHSRWQRLPRLEMGVCPMANYDLDLTSPDGLFEPDDSKLRQQLSRIVHDESVVELDDLILRRTDWGSNPATLDAVRQRIRRLLAHPSDASPDHAEPKDSETMRPTEDSPF